MTVTQILLLVAALQFKHFICDGPLQTKAMVLSKANYGQGQGVLHAALHGIGTMLVLLFLGLPVAAALGLAAIDVAIHYHIDFIKENLVKKKNWTTNEAHFWWALSADQMLHQLTYLGIAWLVFTNGLYLP